jgi:hypothetical protein
MIYEVGYKKSFLLAKLEACEAHPSCMMTPYHAMVLERSREKRGE